MNAVLEAAGAALVVAVLLYAYMLMVLAPFVAVHVDLLGLVKLAGRTRRSRLAR